MLIQGGLLSKGHVRYNTFLDLLKSPLAVLTGSGVLVGFLR